MKNEEVEERKSYANEMNDTDYQLYRQILEEEKATINIFKINLGFLILILLMIIYFLIGPNYILNWKIPNTKDPKHDNIVTIQISLTTFIAYNDKIPFDCFDYSECNQKSSCHFNQLIDNNKLSIDCSSLHQLSIIGIIVSYITILQFSLYVFWLSVWLLM